MTRGRKNDPEDVVVAEVACTHATERALLCVVDGREVWVPQSVVTDDSEVYRKGDVGKLCVKGWFAAKQGWSS